MTDSFQSAWLLPLSLKWTSAAAVAGIIWLPEAVTALSDELVLPQSLITVANEQAQEEIREFLNSRGHRVMKDYFFFC